MNHDQQINELERRLKKVIESHQRLKWIVSSLGLALLVCLFVGATQKPPTTETTMLKLVDLQGQLCALIGTDDEGTPYIRLDNVRKKQKVIITPSGIDVAEDEAILTGVGIESGSPQFYLRNKKGQYQGWFRLEKGNPVIGLGRDKPMIVLSVPPNEAAGLDFFDPEGRPRIGIGLTKAFEPHALFVDDKGQTIWTAPSRPK